jgi:hypothetical protein
MQRRTPTPIPSLATSSTIATVAPGPTPRGRLRGSGCWLTLFLLATACGATSSHPPQVGSAPPTDTKTSPIARFAGPCDTQLAVTFAVPPGQLVAEVRYEVRNTGSRSVMIFDRGTVHDVGIESHVLGAIGAPRQQIAGRDLTLLHVAVPLGEPSPTSPPTPLALELAPGATLVGRCQVMLQGPALPQRLRWCLGMMPKDEEILFAPLATPDGRLWTASFAAVERQQLACSGWFDIDQQRFAGTGQ